MEDRSSFVSGRVKGKTMDKGKVNPNAVTHERQGDGKTKSELYFKAEHKKTKADITGARGKVATKNSKTKYKQKDKVQIKKCKMQNSNPKTYTVGEQGTGRRLDTDKTEVDKYNDQTRSEGNTETKHTDTD